MMTRVMLKRRVLPRASPRLKLRMPMRLRLMATRMKVVTSRKMRLR